MNIQIVKLERAIYEGDWHDKPSRWQVVGPIRATTGQPEVQRFSTREEARKYAAIRQSAGSEVVAHNLYIAAV